ncbi:MAG TPA: HAD-IB family phosphatase [Gemmatimonadaceae bacterium]|jgi:phosphoserine phosphatase
MTEVKYRALVLDVDSTVSGIEGIDWLAARRGPDVAQRVHELTRRAMAGEVALEEVYGSRLSEIRPRREDVEALSREYLEWMAPGATESVARIRRAGVRVTLVSGGLRPALRRLASHLGLAQSDLHAVSLEFDAAGAYLGYDSNSALTTADGKARVVSELRLPRPIVAVGDGATDLAMREVVDAFIAFTGFVSRPRIVARAEATASSFAEVERLLL